MTTSKKFTEMLLNEAYKIESPADYIRAIQSNNIGVKIPQFLRDSFENDEDIEQAESDINTIFKEFERYGIKKVQGMQVLTSLVIPKFNFRYIADKIDYRDDSTDDDGIEAVMLTLKYWNADWMSQERKDSYDKEPLKDKILNAKKNDDLDMSFFADINEDLYNGIYSHGSNGKGKGNWQDVVMLYPRTVYGFKEKINPWEADENGWQLFTPNSFDGERAIAWYGTSPENLKPTEWCTRANIGYYRNYTRDRDGIDSTNLYVIRNIKTGHAWQCAIQVDDFDFLNELDKSDRFTNGDLSIFPDRLLSKVEDDFVSNYGFGTDARSLYDYKMYLENLIDDPEYEDNPNYIKDPYNPMDSNCKNKAELKQIPLDINKFGIQPAAQEHYNFRLYQITNASTYIENDDDELSLRDFFSHDYEIGYEYSDNTDTGEILAKKHLYGKRSGKFWRIIGTYEGKDYYHDIGLSKGQHTYGGFKSVATNEKVDLYMSDSKTFVDNVDSIERKILGYDVSTARGKTRSDATKEIYDRFEQSTLAYMKKYLPKLNSLLKETKLESKNGKHLFIQIPEDRPMGDIRTEHDNGYTYVSKILYPMPIFVHGLYEGDDDGKNEYIQGNIHFYRDNGNELRISSMITDIDTVNAIFYNSDVRYRYDAVEIPSNIKKAIYNFLTGYYVVMRQSVKDYLRLDESIIKMFEEIYSN